MGTPLTTVSWKRRANWRKISRLRTSPTNGTGYGTNHRANYGTDYGASYATKYRAAYAAEYGTAYTTKYGSVYTFHGGNLRGRRR